MHLDAYIIAAWVCRALAVALPAGLAGAFILARGVSDAPVVGRPSPAAAADFTGGTFAQVAGEESLAAPLSRS